MRLFKYKKALLCILSGLTTALCFTVAEIWFLCFFTLIPFLYVLIKYELSAKQVIRYTYCYGLPFFSAVLIWFYVLVEALNRFMSPVLSFITMTLAIILVAFILSSIMAFFMSFFRKIKRADIRDVFSVSALYMLSEWAIGLLGTLAFPWARLANITAWAPWFIQGASLLGSLFVSLIVLIISSLMAYCIINFGQKKSYIAAFAAVLIFAVNSVAGLIRISSTSNENSEPVEILMVQANLAGVNKWETQVSDIFNEHIRLSKENITENTCIVIWPETAIPTEVFDNAALSQTLIDFSIENDITLITGSFANEDGKSYNAMYVISPDGTVSEPYYKQLLVPFGEFTPLKRVISVLAFWVTNTEGLLNDMGRGDECIVYDTPYGSLSGLICYESILPSISTSHTSLGSELTVLISNDSWFGTSSALKQHLSHAVLRAVENNRYVARAGNCGITAIISSLGQIQCSLPIYEEGTLIGNVSFTKDRTLYSYVGDIIVIPAFAYCAYLFLSPIAASVYMKYKKNPNGKSD